VLILVGEGITEREQQRSVEMICWNEGQWRLKAVEKDRQGDSHVIKLNDNDPSTLICILSAFIQ